MNQRLQISRKGKYRRPLLSGCFVVFLVDVEGLSTYHGIGGTNNRFISGTVENPNGFLSKLPLHLSSSSTTSSTFGPSSSNDLPPFGGESMTDQKIKFVSASLEGSSSTQHDQSVVPSWLPYLFTRAQLECLTLVELRRACAERRLKKSGSKAILQDRLMDWVTEKLQQQLSEKKERHKSSIFVDPTLEDRRKLKNPQPKLKKKDKGSGVFDDLSTDNIPDDEDEYIDDNTPKLQPTGVYLEALNHNFYTKTAKFSNLEVQQMYLNSKRADQNGDKILARKILYELHEATPGDGRVIRRLARLALEMKEEDEARRLLQLGTRSMPSNGYLWHGLAQLEAQQGNLQVARELFLKTTEVDPSLPNSFHAWARLEQSQGNIRVAAALLRKGLRFSPNNQRLWHALGGLYRDAGMLREATHAFEKGLECNELSSSVNSKNWSQPFLYTESASISYEMGDVEQARKYLQYGLKLNPIHAQGWLSLAQLEESCESKTNIVRARAVYSNAADSYERARNIYHKNDRRHHSLMISRTSRQPGDKWLTVYLAWAKMEEAFGNYGFANMVYSRAAHVFPSEWEVFLNWAMLHAKRKFVDKAKVTFKKACLKAGRYNAEPYRIYGEYAMELGNHDVARLIFFSGAKAITVNSRDGHVKGLAALLHSWSKCELRLGNVDRAVKLLDRALCVTGNSPSNEKSQLLCTMASAETIRKNYRLAQHYISLALYECGADSPNNASYLWIQWAEIADLMNDDKLAQYFREQAHKVKDKSAVLSTTPVLSENRLMRASLGKTPWYTKLMHGRSKR